MLNNLKLIFVHGVNEQTTNYSHDLYNKILNECQKQLKDKHNLNLETIVQHETLWSDLTTDLTNRYQQLATQQSPHFQFSKIKFFLAQLISPALKKTLIKEIDPLVIQIMHYVKDKGDKKTGEMNILKELNHDIKRIFSKSNQDIGHDPLSGEGKNAIIIAHSLGSVIAFDYIMRLRKDCALDKNITIHSFITIGSPISLFTSAMGHPDSDLKLPDNIKRWINIINPLDGIGRPVKKFFRNIPEDSFKEETVYFGLNPLSAHTDYWKDNQTAKLIAKEIITALNSQTSSSDK